MSKKFMDKREKGGGEYQDLPSKIFCLTVPKNSVAEPFCAVSENSRQRKSLWIRGGGLSRFTVEFFSHSAEKLP